MKPPRFPWNGEFKFTDDELDMIDHINAVLKVPSSPRWIYYSIFDVPDARQQQLLTDILKKARLDHRELIKRDMVTDDTRNPTIWNVSATLYDFLNNLNYTKDIWQDQPEYIEVWMEDQASLQAVIRSPERILQKFRVNARYCKGFNSIGAMWTAFNGDNDFIGLSKLEKPIRILYYGDLNPSGWAIPLVIVRQFQEMGLEIELERQALNVPQLNQYDIPAFTKISGDPRRKEFNEIFGFSDWEDGPFEEYKDEKTGRLKIGKKHLNIDLEKMPKATFESLLEDDLKLYIDIDAFDETLGIELEEAARLKQLTDQFKEEST